jgi:hypothetical protein
MTAVFTALLLSGATSVYAGNGCFNNNIIDPQLHIVDGTVFENPNEVSAKINVCDPVTATGFKGTGILTENSLAVTTTHGGVLDSEKQLNAADPIEHNHYVDLDEASQNCLDTAVGNELAVFQVAQISWESPGVAMWTENMYKIWEVPKEFDGHLAIPNVGIGDPNTFILGDIGAQPQVVSFGIDVGAGGEVCILVKNIVEVPLEDLMKVGGLPMVIDTTALLLAGAQTNLVWIMSALAVIGTVTFGVLYITAKKN